MFGYYAKFCYMCNLLISAAWKIIKTWLSAEAIARIKFVTKSDIQEYINKDQLWEHMGGTVSYYAPAYSKNSGRALSVTPVSPVCLSVCPSVRPYVPLSCPGHNSKTLWNIFMKLHRCIHHNKTMCHEQGRQLLHFRFLNYFPLT